MEALTYSGPDGPDVANPSLDLLEEVILRRDPAHWRRGSGTSGLLVTVEEGPGSYRVVPGIPSLVFFMAGEHGF